MAPLLAERAGAGIEAVVGKGDDRGEASLGGKELLTLQQGTCCHVIGGITCRSKLARLRRRIDCDLDAFGIAAAAVS